MTAASSADRYVDIGALLDGSDLTPPTPSIGMRDDGVCLFYAGQVNLLFGDPESGKTWIALAAVADELARGGSAIVIDLDHNGAPAIVHRLLSMQADERVLRNPLRFRYTAPEDQAHMVAVVADTVAWRPTIALVDSLGELLPLFGASSNSADDFTRVHGQTLKPMAAAGVGVLAIDHLSKGEASRAQGATGTAAKKRAIGGTSLRCTVAEPFRPGYGGRAFLRISKDRHGGLRAHAPADDEPLAATFVLREQVDETLTWTFSPPSGADPVRTRSAVDGDLEKVTLLDPPPRSVRDTADRLHVSWKRAGDALRAWRAAGCPSALPVAHPTGGATSNTDSTVASNPDTVASNTATLEPASA